MHFPVVFRVKSLRPAAARCALLLVAGAATLAACSTPTQRVEQMQNPDFIYQRAQSLMGNGSYDAAIKVFESLTARFPFSDAARQSRLDLIYAYYKKREKESAVDEADTFIRENPTHPRIDYAYYLKGLVYFERDRNFLERWFSVDIAKRPPQDARKSFDAFARVVTQFPNSEYAADARQRMVYLRNRLAEYELHVARYYQRRGAWVAALDRAKYLLENYDGAPATREALEITVAGYDALGMRDLAADARKVLVLNAPGERVAAAASKHWWQFW